MSRRFALGVTTLALMIGPAGVWSMQSTAVAQAGDPFTCRASALRVEGFGALAPLGKTEPVVANDANNPCNTQSVDRVKQPLPAGLGSARVLFADTQTSATPTARAGVAEVTITVPGAPVIRAEVPTAQASAECNNGTNAPTLSGSSKIASLTVGATPVEVTGPQTVSLGPLGNLFLNHQTTSASTGTGPPDTITQRAIFLDTTLVDVVIAEAIADFRGNPCDTRPPPGDTECSDHVDNDGDEDIDFGQDSGCKSLDDDDEADGFLAGGGGYDEVDNQAPSDDDVVAPGDKLRFSVSVSCDVGKKDHLNTTWFEQGQEVSFKMARLTRSRCTNTDNGEQNPAAEFDTLKGEGTGEFKGAGGPVAARAEFTFVDNGEPGSADRYEIKVFQVSSEALLASGTGTLDEGNVQAHSPGAGGGR